MFKTWVISQSKPKFPLKDLEIHTRGYVHLTWLTSTLTCSRVYILVSCQIWVGQNRPKLQFTNFWRSTKGRVKA